MLFIKFNPNPYKRRVGDCVIRALSKALNQSWDETYTGVCLQGFIEKNMPDGNEVWGNYLVKNGFVRDNLDEKFPPDYDVEDFAQDYNKGTYILAIDGHVVCIKDGNIWDTWYSGEEHPSYVWFRE